MNQSSLTNCLKIGEKRDQKKAIISSVGNHMSAYNDSLSHPTAVDTTPLLGDHSLRARSYFLSRPPSLRGAIHFLQRAGSRGRMMREASVRVREAAAEQIEERQSDWAYSKPIVVLDLVWNLAFVMVSIYVLIMSRRERPSWPLRLWIVGYALQCLLHMVCVCVEYRKRYFHRNSARIEWEPITYSRSALESIFGSGDLGSGAGHDSELRQSCVDQTSVVKHLESANTMFSFIWWIIGFYWISAGDETLPTESPQLHWLSIIFLGFDVLFVMICASVACVIGVAVCCCLPCIIAILYAVADQEGATKEDIERLPKFRFQKTGDFEKQDDETQESFGGIMAECDTASPAERVLPLDDAECCICLCDYDDGAELRELPCRHHFHSACIDKWLHINASCPLCKFDIMKNGSHADSEEV